MDDSVKRHPKLMRFHTLKMSITGLFAGMPIPLCLYWKLSHPARHWKQTPVFSTLFAVVLVACSGWIAIQFARGLVGP